MVRKVYNAVQFYTTAGFQKEVFLLRTIRKRLSRTPLWAILTLLSFASLMTLTLFFTIRYYRHSRSSTIRNEIDCSRQLSSLRIINLDRYLDTLAQFAVQPCYNAILSQALNTYQAVDEDALLDAARAFVQSSYFSRNDLISLRITFLSPGLTVYRGNDTDHTLTRSVDPSDITDSEAYRACAASPLNCALFAAEQNGRRLLHYCHTLIRISDQKVTALVELVLDPACSVGQTSGRGSGRFVLLTDENGHLIYSDLPAKAASAFLAKKAPAEEDESGRLINLKDTPYLMTSAYSTRYGLTLCSFSSYDRLMEAFRGTARTTAADGFLLFVILMASAYVVIRFFTKPLTLLAKKQGDFGGGDFTHVHLTGCREVSMLAESFNKMSDSLNRLIEQNYAARINEQNAQLKALEAQINPHFLYNTLQAIGSEALTDTDGTTVYSMLTTLADCLRYTIRASDTVTLREELRYVDNYYRLQKLRKGDRLTLDENVSQDLLDLPIPKVSLQNLVENSIRHGLSDDVTSIRIQLNAETDGTNLLLSVTDDGCGIPEAELHKLRTLFDERRLTNPDTGVGLPNLFNRLKILYRDADVLTASRTGADHGTKVTLRIPIHAEKGSECSLY